MARMPLKSGDVVDVVVTRVLPFGALVQDSSGVPGLVPGTSSDVGATLRVEVVDVDDAEHRFSARLT